MLIIASSFHVDHELVDFVPIGEPEYDEVIEEYEEEILVQEEAQEPVGANPADPTPAQAKPQSITHIFMITEYIYICNVHLSYRYFMETTYINIPTHESY